MGACMVATTIPQSATSAHFSLISFALFLWVDNFCLYLGVRELKILTLPLRIAFEHTYLYNLCSEHCRQICRRLCAVAIAQSAVNLVKSLFWLFAFPDQT